MKTHLVFAVVLIAGVVQASAAEQEAASSPPTKALKSTQYTIYGGELGDEKAPTKDDRKLAIEVSGPAAKEIFDSIYPDAKVTCSGEKGERLRRKQNLWCAYMPRQGYRCFIGVDLRTGDSIPGGSC